MNKKLIIISLLLGIVLTFSYYNTFENIEITVIDKERITTGTGENFQSKYLIFTENEVFENTDDLFYGKFNSSDFQGKLKIGDTYNVKVIGRRIPFINSYRNIVKINDQKDVF